MIERGGRRGFSAAVLAERVAAWTLAVTLATGCAVLWWPSIHGWRAMCAAVPAVWLCWLLSRCISGRRTAPGNWLHVATAVMLAMATWHGLADGLDRTTGWPTPLVGQFSGSLAIQIFMISLLVMLCDDLLATRRLWVQLAVAAAAVLGAAAALGLSSRPEGRWMLRMQGLAGAALACEMLSALVIPPRTASKTIRRLLRAFGWLMLLASLTVMVAVALSGGSTAGVSLLGRGDEALARVADWSSSWILLAGSLGLAAAAAMPLLFVVASAVILLRGGRDGRINALAASGFSILAMGLALACWMAPGGAFSPAANLLLAFCWSAVMTHLPTGAGARGDDGAPSPLFTRRPQHSGWLLMLAVGWSCVLLALIRKMGLLLWILEDRNTRDMVLHGFFGGVITLLLMWLWGRYRWGALAALLVSLGISAAGELAQKLFSMRSYELSDFIDHACAAVIAAALFGLCRAAARIEKKPPRPHR